MLAARTSREFDYTGLSIFRCEGCGLEQTSGVDEWPFDEPWHVRPCVLCGCLYASHAGWICPELRAIPIIQSPLGPFLL